MISLLLRIQVALMGNRMSEEVWSYFVCKVSSEGRTPRFEIFSSLEDARTWCNSVQAEDDEKKGEKRSDSPVAGFTPEDIMLLLNRFIDQIASYKALFAVTASMRSIVYKSVVRREITERAEGQYKEVEEVSGYTIRAIMSSQFAEFDRALDTVLEIGRGLSVLPGSNLLSLVATFDSFIADIAFRSVRGRPDFFDDATMVPLKMLAGLSSLEGVLDQLAWQQAQDCMRGSHTAQIQFLEKISSTAIIKEFERWPEFVEIFERRNLVAHNSLIVNRTYLNNVSEAGYDVTSIEIGSLLAVSGDYLGSSVDILLEFGILLLYSFWKKRYKNSAVKAYESLNEIAYDLIRRKNPLVASRILNFALNKQRHIGPDAIAKRMTVNLANCYKKMNDNDRLNSTLSSMDWSSSSDTFKICIAALNEDVERVVSLMPKVTDDQEEVGIEGFRHWPVFDAVRDDPRFIMSFESTFEEPLRASSFEQEKLVETANIEVPAGLAKSSGSIH